MGHIDIVFDGPPSHVAGRFVEVEDENGRSIKFGEWVQRDDGYWVLRFPKPKDLAALDRLRALAAEATSKGEALQQSAPELRVAGIAYRGMGERILAAMTDEDDG